MGFDGGSEKESPRANLMIGSGQEQICHSLRMEKITSDMS
jgi:hypothetical protein